MELTWIRMKPIYKHASNIFPITELKQELWDKSTIWNSHQHCIFRELGRNPLSIKVWSMNLVCGWNIRGTDKWRGDILKKELPHDYSHNIWSQSPGHFDRTWGIATLPDWIDLVLPNTVSLYAASSRSWKQPLESLRKIRVIRLNSPISGEFCVIFCT